jgi:hypothetical protein
MKGQVVNCNGSALNALQAIQEKQSVHKRLATEIDVLDKPENGVACVASKKRQRRHQNAGNIFFNERNTPQNVCTYRQARHHNTVKRSYQVTILGQLQNR